jgi:hypothetical protein
MAQTTGGITGAAATVSIYVSSAYVDISGSSQSIETTTATVVTGEAYTFDGNFALTTVGKYEPVEVKVNIIYTETAAEAFQSVRALFEARTATQLKWLPAGAASGADQYETKTKTTEHKNVKQKTTNNKVKDNKNQQTTTNHMNYKTKTITKNNINQ